MLKEVFNHLRHTQCFTKYKEKVCEYNAEALGLFIIAGIVVSLFALFLELVLLRTPDFWFVIFLLVYFLIAYLIYRKNIEEHVDHSTLWLYFAQIPVLLLAVVMGTVINPNTKAFTLPIMLVAFPLTILDKPGRVLLYILGILTIFILADFQFKTGELLRHDILHALITGAISFTAAVFVLNDRIENVEKSQMFLTDSEHDPLTGIYNRRGGEEKIRECVNDGIGGTFILLDIDDFKHVNDTYGHAMGDEVLSAVSITLSSSFRSSDVIMRMGGDEFVVYAPGLVNYFFIDGKLQQINARMREITCASGKDNITVSMGAVINDGSYPDYESLFNEADSLLYEMKKGGKNGFRLQDRTYAEVKARADRKQEEVAKNRAEREAASAAEEQKYKR